MNAENILSKLNLSNDQVLRKQANITEFVRLITKLKELDEIVDDKQEKYNSLQKTNSKIRSNITELEVIHESQQVQKINLKHNVKNLKKNIKQTSASVERLKDLDVNNEKFKKQLMKLTMLKRCFKIHLDDKSPPHIIRGIFGDISSMTIEPFEFNCTKMDENEIAENILKHLGATSEFKEAWEKLFNSKTLIHTGSTDVEEEI